MILEAGIALLETQINCLFSISFIADNRKCISFLHGCSCGKNALNMAPEALMEYFLVYGGPTIWRNNYMPLVQILTQTWSVQLYSYTISIWQKCQCCFLLLVVCILPRKNNQMTMQQVYQNAGATMLSLSLTYKSLSTSPFNVGLITCSYVMTAFACYWKESTFSIHCKFYKVHMKT